MSARLSDELLYCITSITPRARYYAFFPWAFQDYNDHERAKRGDRGRIKGVLVRERAMVLGAVLHHDGHPCEGGGLGGSDEATKIARKKRRSFDLSRWEHLGAPEGQFGAAYKGSLINLGVFKTDDERVKGEADADTAEPEQEMQDIDVRELSDLGKRVATAFGQSVHNTEYVKKQWTLRNATIQPNSPIPCGNAASRALCSGSSAVPGVNTPTRRMRSRCCARAASGHAAAPPSSVMNSRRFTARCLPCYRRKDTTARLRQETAALRHFSLAYDGFGSDSAVPRRP